jgi:hypothetical protein
MAHVELSAKAQVRDAIMFLVRIADANLGMFERWKLNLDVKGPL